ncbi:MAG TPA: hybrid sensor histidine kinase/response regulator [Polyangiaceae bacterium]|nr:hybrid sensor histidine kinase/response regulator [Polyangiaceae bacterium]
MLLGSISSRPLRILVVDDEATNLRVLSSYLKDANLEPTAVGDGRAALDVFPSLAPDLVLLDLIMPELGGLDVLVGIRQHPALGETPVIVMTGFTDRQLRLEAIEHGADDVLEKPLDPDVLLARVATLIKLKLSRDELKASHAALARQNDELERAQREQRELTEFIVHDLKGPLTGIVANTEWVYEQLSRQESGYLGALEDVLSSASRLRAMINDLMTVSQLERGTFPVRRRTVAMGPLLRSVVRDFSRAAEQRQIELSAPHECEVDVEVDVDLIQRVLGNILENSLRYTPERGKVALDAHLAQKLEIEIKNSGPPIPKFERDLIFEKFRRGSGAGLTHGNAGLGLYFCKRAVQAHGGDIQVVETPDYPTCFLIRLPADSVNDASLA